MALEKQNINISFAKGLDTKSDPKQVIPGKLLLLQNATFKSAGQFKKRSGYGVISSALSTSRAIAAYNSELIVIDDAYVYSYDEAYGDLNPRGKKTACDISVDSITRNSYQQTHPDSAILNGTMCFAYNDSSGQAFYTVIDQVTKSVFASAVPFGSAAQSLKVLALGNYFYIFFIDSGSTLKFLTVTPRSPATFHAYTVATLDTQATHNGYDACIVGSSIACVYADSTPVSGSYQDMVVLITSGYPNPVIGTPFGTGRLPVTRCIFPGPGGVMLYAGILSDGSAFYCVISSTNTSYVSSGTLDTDVRYSRVNISGIYTSAGAQFFIEVAGTTGSASDHWVIATVPFLIGSSPTSSFILLRSVGLWSKPFIYGGTTYLVVSHQSTLQSCYFVVAVNTTVTAVLDANSRVISRVATENGGGLSTNGLLREVNLNSASSFQFAYLIKDFVTSSNGNVYTQTGVNSLNLTFDGPMVIQNIGNNLNLSGGIVSTYDGLNVTEKNFHLYPEDLQASTSQSGGGLQVGTYQYSALYEWTDNKGQVHQSAQSIPTTLVTSITNIFLGGSTPFSGGVSLNNANDMYYLSPGMAVTGPGVSAGTYLTYPQLNTSISVSTGYSGTYTYTPGKSFQGRSSIGSNVVSIIQQTTEYYLCSCTAGSNVLTLSLSATVRPGTSISGEIGGVHFGGAVVSQSGNFLYMNAPATFTTSGLYFQGTLYLVGNISNGSNVITSVSQTPLYSVGDVCAFNAAPGGVFTVTAVSASTITTNYTFTTTTSSVPFQVSLPVRYPSIGDVYTDLSGTFSNPTVKAIGGGTVTLASSASASASPINFVTGSAIGGQVTIPTLRVTDKQAVSIALYRTLVNQSVFYRVSSLSTPLINNKTIDSITFNDSVSDSLLIGNEQLYTTGEVVDNFPPPPSSISWTYKNRAMLVPSESTRQVWFSKPAIPGVSVEFSDQFVINVPEEGGAITAGAQLDDKNIIFKRGAIFAHNGDGPANTGFQNDFGDPQKIASDSGCINQKSIVLIPTGLMFQSEKGIYLLDRSLQVSYIGHDVEAYNGRTITSAKLIRDLNEVRFSLQGTSETLVFDYTTGEWSIYTNPEVTDATIYQNTYTYVSPTGKIYKETKGVFLDDTAPVLLGLKTSWLSFAGLQAFMRAYKMLILGEYKSPHSLVLNIAYDFKNTYNQTKTITVPSAPSGAYQWRVDFDIQKCEAIQITLSEQQSASYGEGLSLSAFTLEVGAKKGLNKIP